ncbi:MAG TPA: cupin domain-containing protein [Polyangia bacterium]|nr:cupin domain-containing protein [Polyangia bacterium]
MGPITAERIRAGQLDIIFFASAEQTDGKADVFEVVVPAGARVPAAHHHVEVDEVVYVLEGTVTYTLAGMPHTLGVGQSLFAPKGVEHHFANLHAGTARFLSVLTPAKIGPAYFREVADVINAPGPPDLAKIKDIMFRHGLVPAAPRP